MKNFFACSVLFAACAHSEFDRPRFPAADSADSSRVSAQLLAQYSADPKVAALFSDQYNRDHLVPTVTSLEFTSPNHFSAVLEIGYRASPMAAVSSFNYFPQLLQILNGELEGESVRAKDVTREGLPTKTLWAHYRMSPGGIGVFRDPNKMRAGAVQGIKIYYSVPVATKADVFVPIASDADRLMYRVKMLKPGADISFTIKNASISAGISGLRPEECDGTLAFGVQGGGRTGWCPWTIEFINVVDGVGRVGMNQLTDASNELLPRAVAQ